MSRPINRWIICLNGYSQGDRQRTGVGRIYRDILSTCACPDTFLSLSSWRDDMSAVADNIMEWGVHKPEVVIIGYSYGGWTSVLLCRELAKREIDVQDLVLIDAVWRPWQRVASFRSLFDGASIVIPPSVYRVLSWTQKVNKPSGHPVKVDETRTTIDQRSLVVAHAYADDQPEVREAALQIACPGKLGEKL